MSLRSRLVVALVVVVTIGLVAFGLVTASLYRHSLLEQLDGQLATAIRPQSNRLRNLLAAGAAQDSCSDGTQTAPAGGPADSAPELHGLDADTRLFVAGQQVACVPALASSGSPRIPADVATTDHALYRTVPSASGGGSWRLFATPIGTPDAADGTVADQVLVVAKPTSALDESMSRLIRIELATGAGLLVLLAVGAWLVLRQGLRPLERMAASASRVTAGDLSSRVEPADESSEIGQLGLAINSMLTGIEDAFTEREATEARLRQFLADASHELRTPITSIQGFAELYRIGDDRHPADLDVIMPRIESEAARMHTLVEDLMLLARLDRTREVRTDPVDLSVLAADACTDASAQDTGRHITLDAPTPVVVSGDADHLRQAITNLLSNALGHTPVGTAVEVRTRGDGNTATVTVRDHGTGLDPQGLAHAFDRFWQADAARRGTGSGLGLSIVSGIAAEHQGRVTVENAADGGAVFTLAVPVAP